MAKYKSNRAIEQIQIILTNLKTIFVNQKNYTGLTNGTAINIGAIPQEMYQEEESTIKTAIDSQLYIKDSKTKTNPSGSFIVEINNIPSAFCMALASFDWGGEDDSLIALAFGGYGYLNEILEDSVPDTHDEDGTVTCSFFKPQHKFCSIPLNPIQAAQICGNSGFEAISIKYR